MIKKHLTSLLHENMPHTPTGSQLKLIGQLAEFLATQGGMKCFVIKGFAGTGKTTLIYSIVQALDSLGLRTILMAPTGRAAKVLSAYAGKTAHTIHKTIYRQKSSADWLGEFVLDRNLHKDCLFVVDEASMIANQVQELNIFGSGRLLDDLVRFVYNGRNCKLLLVGDTAQLPPVGLDLSPALDIPALQKLDLGTEEGFLDDIVRQSEGSGILFNATLVRRLLETGKYSLPGLVSGKYPDVERISGSDFSDILSSVYDRSGMDETVVVTRSNKRANLYNRGIRNQVLGREEELCKGDRLMVVKNNYYWLSGSYETDFIANGDILEVTWISNFEEKYGRRFADVSLRFTDYTQTELEAKIILDTLDIESASLPNQEARELFDRVIADYEHISQKKKRFQAAREDPYYNALQIKFAYAVTCHKAQGGQWKNVFVDQGFMRNGQADREYLRWLYTAFTRATEKLYLVNFPSFFFPGEED